MGDPPSRDLLPVDLAIDGGLWCLNFSPRLEMNVEIDGIAGNASRQGYVEVCLDQRCDSHHLSRVVHLRSQIV